MNFAEWFKKTYAEHGKTQLDAAIELELSQSTISHYINNQKFPSVERQTELVSKCPGLDITRWAQDFVSHKHGGDV